MARNDKVIETDNKTYGVYEVSDIYKDYIDNYRISIIEGIKVVNVSLKENSKSISYSLICINKNNKVFRIIDVYESFNSSRDQYLVRLPINTNYCYLVVNEANDIKIENDLLSKNIKKEMFINSFLFALSSSFSYFFISLIVSLFKIDNDAINYNKDIFKYNLPSTWIYITLGIFIFIFMFFLSLLVYYLKNLKKHKEKYKKMKYKIKNKKKYSEIHFKHTLRFLKMEVTILDKDTNETRKQLIDLNTKVSSVRINKTKLEKVSEVKIINASFKSYTYCNDKFIKGEIKFKHNSEAKIRRYKGNVTLSIISIFCLLIPLVSSIYMNVCFNEYNNLSSTFIYKKTNNYDDEDKNITITEYKGHSRRVIIPKKIDGYTVYRLDSGLFQKNYVLKEVALPSSITSLSNNLFHDCISLDTFDFSRFKNIPSGCFANTGISDLDGMYFSTISSYGFAYNKLKTVNILSDSYFLGNRAFFECSIDNLTINSNCTNISINAFKGTHIKNLYLNNSFFNLDNYLEYFPDATIENVTFGSLSNHHEED